MNLEIIDNRPILKLNVQDQAAASAQAAAVRAEMAELGAQEVLSEVQNLVGAVKVMPDEVYSSDNLNETINNTPYSTIIVGTDSIDLFLLDKPITITSPNKVIIINGIVKVKDGHIQQLTSDAPAGSTSVFVDGADQYFFIGQQIVVTDNDKQLQGGGTSQVRRFGDAIYVAGVTSDQIILSAPLRQSFLVSSNARVGHFQSAFIIKASNVKITGNGLAEIDVNRANQNDEILYPVMVSNASEDTDFGCGITVSIGGYSGIEVVSITVRNAPLHNFCFREAIDFVFFNIKAYNAHDKNALFFNCKGAFIDNLLLDGSMYEDGLSLYAGNIDFVIGSIIIKNHPRYGFLFNSSNFGIVVTSILGFNNANNGISGSNIQIGNLILNSGDMPMRTYDPALLIIGNTSSSPVKDVTISALHIMGSKERGLTIRGFVDNVTIQTLHLSNTVRESIVMWGSARAKIMSGTIHDVDKVFTVIDTAQIEIDNMRFYAFASSNLSAKGPNAVITLRNCQGIS